MTKKDLLLVGVIGAAVGLLIQPVLTNTNAVASLHSILSVPAGLVRPIVFIAFLVLAPLAFTLAAYMGRFIPIVYQIAKFAAVGSLNSFIDLGVFNLEILLSGQRPEDLSTSLFFVFASISFLFATTNSFFWNKLWTFGDTKAATSQKVAIFYAITALTYGLNTGVATTLKAIGPLFSISQNIWVSVVAKVGGIFASMAINFLAYKFIVFRQNQTAVAPDPKA